MSTLREQFLYHVGRTSPSPLMIEVARAEGVFFYTPEGERYFDLVSGVSVSNVGHSNERVKEAVKRQVDDYMHVMVYGELIERPQVEYAKRLCGEFDPTLNSLYYVNSGAEAVEVAMKLAKRYTGRTELVSFKGAYHGSTQGAMSVMGGEEFRYAYRPLLPDVRQIEFDNRRHIEQITERTAAVIIEPVQGEAGVRLPSAGYLDALRERCDETGALLVFDEIQTGFGRCGALFAHQKYGVVPDILCLGKAFGGGMPLGGIVSSATITSSFTHNPVLGHISTFGGHPVCCAAGLAALEYNLEHNLSQSAEIKGALFEELLGNHPSIAEIRRSGLLMAIELGDNDFLAALMEQFRQAGIMSDWFLFCDTAFRISPPLTITREEVHECCSIITACLERC